MVSRIIDINGVVRSDEKDGNYVRGSGELQGFYSATHIFNIPNDVGIISQTSYLHTQGTAGAVITETGGEITLVAHRTLRGEAGQSEIVYVVTPNDSGGWNAPVLADGTENQLGRRYGRFAHDVAAADIRAVAYQGCLLYTSDAADE